MIKVIFICFQDELLYNTNTIKQLTDQIANMIVI